MSKPLSPAAQAVLNAYLSTPGHSPALAAALDALADQVAPMPDEADQDRIPDGADRQESIRHRILRIAAELRGGQADG